ncbi:Hypothetical protein NTJ_10764 [Nesidiocoris tenuis]|uniref:Uncharacterized protein n=1 Tax=Nesidiocoris tenuis TaxID=355587 RepID=A0ABN7B2Y5_9HEMI|nr:Hypothetical protein NTJ_10764 [Nesidiocoris tenuis]
MVANGTSIGRSIRRLVITGRHSLRLRGPDILEEFGERGGRLCLRCAADSEGLAPTDEDIKKDFPSEIS